jgi:omega-3 fatty acid desaturase (delta-15 desaturase)
LTHNKHHKNTNNIDKDEMFYPQRGVAHEPSLMDDILFWLPGIGWFYYLFFGYTPRTINHFNPVNYFLFKDLDFICFISVRTIILS